MILCALIEQLVQACWSGFKSYDTEKVILIMENPQHAEPSTIIETDDAGWRDGVRQYESVSSFVISRLDKSFYVSDPERIEEITKNTMIGLANLVEVLYKKGAITLQDVGYIATSEKEMDITEKPNPTHP